MASFDTFLGRWSKSYHKHCSGDYPRQEAVEKAIALLGHRYRIQHPFAWAGAVVDFYLPDLLLIVEIDGREHRSGSKLASDQERDAKMAAKGYRTIRIRNEDVDDDANEAVHRAIGTLGGNDG